jgi:hypothetical protein
MENLLVVFWEFGPFASGGCASSTAKAALRGGERICGPILLLFDDDGEKNEGAGLDSLQKFAHRPDMVDGAGPLSQSQFTMRGNPAIVLSSQKWTLALASYVDG